MTDTPFLRVASTDRTPSYVNLDFLGEDSRDVLDPQLLSLVILRLEQLGVSPSETADLLNCSVELVTGRIPKPFRLSSETRDLSVGLLTLLRFLEKLCPTDAELSEQLRKVHPETGDTILSLIQEDGLAAIDRLTYVSVLTLKGEAPEQ